VLSDASPKLSGQKTYDQARAIELGENALSFAEKILKPGGNFVVKSFQGQDFNTLINLVRDHFLSARTFRPHSTRKGSTEIYIVAKNFIGREWNNETLNNCTNETKGPV
jgi:23S rRNA (uridine2552-2'-O)-methyltransferase